MKPLVLDFESLQKWYETEERTYAYDSDKKKRLNVTLNGGFKIYIDGKCVWQGIQPHDAVEKFNEL